MKRRKLLVIAKKYNDIFYALSTSEWNEYDEKILIIIVENNNSNNYPLQKLFNKVFVVNFSGQRRDILSMALQINKIKDEIICNTLFLSNPILIINQYIIKKSKPQNIILLEDGLMNYYDFKASNSLTKKIFQISLGINQTKLLNTINTTYLLEPDLGVYYYGTKKRLKINGNIILKEFNPIINFENKSIFVGQCLYKYGYITLNNYCDFVNSIIKEFNIDYYLPHPFASNQENIKCEILNLRESRMTLEMYAMFFSFEIFSFNSSILYSTPIINKNIVTHLLSLPRFEHINNIPILKRYCSSYINISNDFCK